VKRQAHITLVNGVDTSALDIADRGLAYGDGLFETMRVVSGKVPLLQWHLDRFELGVRCLGLGSVGVLLNEFNESLQQALAQASQSGRLDSAIVKIIISRGLGGRGYLPPTEAKCTFIAQVFDAPAYPAEYADKGVLVKSCDLRLATQPAFAGIKHLNRLEQVIASQELDGEQEGLLFDQNGNLIEGTKSNVLLFEGDQVFTPTLKRCGVKGTLRQYLLDNSALIGLDIQQVNIEQARLDSVDGMAMINSVFGVWPVTTLNGKSLKKHENCRVLQQYIHKHLKY